MPTRINAGALLQLVDAARQVHREAVDPGRRAALGQYFTPPATALRMAAMFRLPQQVIRVLDPGAGAGALTAALVATLIAREEPPTRIELTAIEFDPLLLPIVRATLVACEEVARTRDVVCTWRLVEGDYLQWAAGGLESDLFGTGPGSQYEAAILNPPYKKINTGTRPRRILERVGLAATNLYAGFVGLAVAQLAPGGEYVAVTPRSWCNGAYFAPFRRWLLERTSLESVHVYGRRDAAFSDDDVLTESVIYHGVRAPQSSTVTISESASPESPDSAKRQVPFTRVVRIDDPHAYVHLAFEDEGLAAAQAVRELPCSLATLGVQVSTGRVVDFRARSWLRQDPVDTGYPIIYPGHFGPLRVHWPRLGSKKPNGLAADAPADLLVPSGYYTLVKRFSSKEERRRIVATVYDPAYVPGEWVGLENHVNYFHARGRPLDPQLAYGLAAYLNSRTVDVAFRQFSGHTQVNATDLRALRYPSAATLRAAGAAMLADRPLDAERIIGKSLAPVALDPTA